MTAPKPAADLGPAIEVLLGDVRRCLRRRHHYEWSGGLVGGWRRDQHNHIRSHLAAVRVLRKAQEAPLRIEAAAIRVNGVTWALPAPARHCHLIHAWCTAHWVDGGPGRIGDHEQGFVTASGAFVGREAAALIAIEAGQIESLSRAPNLYSEDLW